MTIEILRANPDITDEVLAERLALKCPANALFWRRKAIEILSVQEQTGKTPVVGNTETWVTTARMNGKR